MKMEDGHVRQSLSYYPPRLSEAQLSLLCKQVCDAAEYMADEQILCLADHLHDALRTRRQLRGKTHQKLEERLCHDSGQPFPY